jgi:hypothetical protein
MFPDVPAFTQHFGCPGCECCVADVTAARVAVAASCCACDATVRAAPMQRQFPEPSEMKRYESPAATAADSEPGMINFVPSWTRVAATSKMRSRSMPAAITSNALIDFPASVMMWIFPPAASPMLIAANVRHLLPHHVVDVRRRHTFREADTVDGGVRAGSRAVVFDACHVLFLFSDLACDRLSRPRYIDWIAACSRGELEERTLRIPQHPGARFQAAE